ncbi:hypothetical protein R3P38DRAFT_3166154 [Favolaschia claudopus]|uniref:Uncharacterized protein n=1 Tax=Favolaschia claudopus TaxID=2862362 RepID=A0AAW0E9Q3_9AGAR
MSLDPDFIAARHAAVQRSLDMIKEANQLRDMSGDEDWGWARTRAEQTLNKFARLRVPKIQRAAARRSTRLLYLSLREEFERQAPGCTDELTWAGAMRGVDEGWLWGGSSAEWPPVNPAQNHPGYWLREKDDKISPYIIPQIRSSDFTIVPLEI